MAVVHSKSEMEHPHFTSIEVSKKCQAEWSALGSEGRKKYQDMSTEDKTRRTNEMEAELKQCQESKENEPNKR